MTTATNSTQDHDPASSARLPLVVSFYVPTFLISVIGNGFVIYSLVYLKRRQRTTIDCYILNLAIADILTTTLSLFNAVEYTKNEWCLGEVMCKIHGHLLEAGYTVSVLTLLALSFNRSKVVGDPFKVMNAKKTLKRDILLIWFAALLFTSPLSYAYTVAKRKGRFHCSNTNFNDTSRRVYYLLQAVMLFFIPVLVMIVSQRKIKYGLQRHSQSCSEALDCRNAHRKRMMTNQKRIGKYLTWIWVVFVFCFTPHIILRTINHFTSLRKISEIWNQFWHASQLLALLNSTINPFLYYRTTSLGDGVNFNVFVKILCCLCAKTDDTRETTVQKQSHPRSGSVGINTNKVELL